MPPFEISITSDLNNELTYFLLLLNRYTTETAFKLTCVKFDYLNGCICYEDVRSFDNQLKVFKKDNKYLVCKYSFKRGYNIRKNKFVKISDVRYTDTESRFCGNVSSKECDIYFDFFIRINEQKYFIGFESIDNHHMLCRKGKHYSKLAVKLNGVIVISPQSESSTLFFIQYRRIEISLIHKNKIINAIYNLGIESVSDWIEDYLKHNDINTIHDILYYLIILFNASEFLNTLSNRDLIYWLEIEDIYSERIIQALKCKDVIDVITCYLELYRKVLSNSDDKSRLITFENNDNIKLLNGMIN